MCGIAGFIDFNGHTDELTLRSMTDTLHHRGPDDSGYYYDKYRKPLVGLGHRRLSILDLSPHGHQPMQFQHITISYNGEIYNFKEIRAELEQHDYRFDSNTDTEVILKSYHCWGTEMLQQFNGMFAIALYDQEKEKILLFRDRAGVKPLYYYFYNDLFLFASELKSFYQHPAFKKELNNDGLALFLQYGYIPQPHTIFKDCYKLKGGYFLSIDLRNKNIDQTKYWDVMDCYRQPKLQVSEQEAIEETEKILKSAFEYRMVSDVPVGMFLSGGYDSSVVAAILQKNRKEKIKTFTIGFHEEEYNEANYAKEIAEYLGTDHTEYYCTQKDALDILPLLPEIWDEPFADPSVIPTVLVSQLARKQVTVSLSADGGDEIFGGYEKYTYINKIRSIFGYIPPFGHDIIRRLLKNPITNIVAERCGFFNARERIKRLSYILGCDENQLLTILSSSFMPLDLKKMLVNPFSYVPTDFDQRLNGSRLDNIQAIDYKTYQIDDILTKVDRATMSVGLEGREPLLDYRIIEYVARLDPSLKIRMGEKKYLLKQIAYKYIPKKLLNRPKTGFGIPIQEWFRKDLGEYLSHYLDEDILKRGGIFNPGVIINLWNSYLSGEKIYVSRIWKILIFQMWKERWCQ